MFKKIDCELGSLNLEKLKGKLFEDHKTFVMFDISDWEYLKSILSKRLKFNIDPVKVAVIEIAERGLRPHTDGYVGCSLNYIIEDTESYTVFWKKIDSTGRIPNLKKTLDGKVTTTETTGYNYRDLEYVTSFKSTVNDMYLIDVSSIHSVEKYKSSVKRKLLSFRWDPKYSLDEIYSSIELLYEVE